jgi:hypothetical protein
MSDLETGATRLQPGPDSRETEPAIITGLGALARFAEPLAQPLLNPGPFVLDEHADESGSGRTDPELDPPPRGGGFDRVAEKVQNRVVEARRIGDHPLWWGIGDDRYFDTRLGGGGPNVGNQPAGVGQRINGPGAPPFSRWKCAEPVGRPRGAAREFTMPFEALRIGRPAQCLYMTEEDSEPIRGIVEGLPLRQTGITPRTGLLGGTRFLSRGTAPGMWLRAIHRVNLLAD